MTKTFRFYSLLLAALCLGSVTAFAADGSSSTKTNESSMKIENATGSKNKVSGDIDQEITNARMRAESGSKSKWSMSVSGGYTGGALSRPFSVDRPNLSGEPGNQVDTSLDGGISARYRWSKNDSIQLGTSFGLQTPFQGDVDKKGNQFNVYDPSVEYDRVGRIGDLQTTFAVGASAGTSNESQSIDRLSVVSMSVVGLKSFQNGLTLGLSLGADYRLYDSSAGKNADAYIPSYGHDGRTEWSLGLYPFAEYAFNDTFSFRTVFGYFNWRHLYGDTNSARLLQTFVYQSVGIGMAISRNVYLYPNIQFVPDNIRSDFTNVALSATINVF